MRTNQLFSVSRVLTVAFLAVCASFLASCGSDDDNIEGPDPDPQPTNGYFGKYKPFTPCVEWGRDTLHIFSYMKTYKDFQDWGKPYVYAYDGGGGFHCTYYTFGFFPKGICIGYGFGENGLDYADVTYEWSDENDWQTLLNWAVKQYGIQEWYDIREQWDAHQGYGYAGGRECNFYLSIDKGEMNLVITPLEKI